MFSHDPPSFANLPLAQDAEELNQSDPLRSALRSVTGASDYGPRTTDVITLILDIGEADSPDGWADQALNVNHLDDMLTDRLGLVEAEIEAWLQRAVMQRCGSRDAVWGAGLL